MDEEQLRVVSVCVCEANANLDSWRSKTLSIRRAKLLQREPHCAARFSQRRRGMCTVIYHGTRVRRVSMV